MKSNNDTMRFDGIKTGVSGIKDHLINYLRLHDYKVIDESEARCKKCLTVVSKTGKKEVIEVWYGAMDTSKKTNAEFTHRDANAQSHTSFPEAWLGSFLNFGRCFFGERMTVAVGIPDTRDFRLMIERLQFYFTENNISRKVYLVDAYGNISVLNLNQLTKTDL
jgi:hypothetical protein